MILDMCLKHIPTGPSDAGVNTSVVTVSFSMLVVDIYSTVVIGNDMSYNAHKTFTYITLEEYRTSMYID